MDIFLEIIGILFAFFIFWRNLKQDYKNEGIFSLTILTSIFTFLGVKIFYFQGGVIGQLVSIFLFSRYNKWNFWLIADSLVFPDIVIVLVFTKDLFYFGLTLIVAILNLRMKKIYRSLSWYKSGKVGFLFCFSLIAFFGPFLILEILKHKDLYFKLTDLGLFFGGVILLYLRAERNLIQDFQSWALIFKKFKIWQHGSSFLQM